MCLILAGTWQSDWNTQQSISDLDFHIHTSLALWVKGWLLESCSFHDNITGCCCHWWSPWQQVVVGATGGHHDNRLLFPLAVTMTTWQQSPVQYCISTSVYVVFEYGTKPTLQQLFIMLYIWDPQRYPQNLQCQLTGQCYVSFQKWIANFLSGFNPKGPWW